MLMNIFRRSCCKMVTILQPLSTVKQSVAFQYVTMSFATSSWLELVCPGPVCCWNQIICWPDLVTVRDWPLLTIIYGANAKCGPWLQQPNEFIGHGWSVNQSAFEVRLVLPVVGSGAPSYQGVHKGPIGKEQVKCLRPTTLFPLPLMPCIQICGWTQDSDGGGEQKSALARTWCTHVKRREEHKTN